MAKTRLKRTHPQAIKAFTKLKTQNTMKTQELKSIYEKMQINYGKSKWSKGVNEYALELLEELVENHETTKRALLQKQLLNGATSWKDYSYGGCSLIYDSDIAKRLATTSEIKKRTFKNGTLNNYANKNETWLDVQERALFQAYRRIKEILYIWEKF